MRMLSRKVQLILILLINAFRDFSNRRLSSCVCLTRADQLSPLAILVHHTLKTTSPAAGEYCTTDTIGIVTDPENAFVSMGNDVPVISRYDMTDGKSAPAVNIFVKEHECFLRPEINKNRISFWLEKVSPMDGILRLIRYIIVRTIFGNVLKSVFGRNDL